MKTLLINSAKIGKDVISAHSRNAIEISKRLNIDLVSCVEDLENLNRADYDKFCFIGTAFYEKREDIRIWIRKGNIAKVFFINNEYNTQIQSGIQKFVKDNNSCLISNVIEKSNKVKHYDEFVHLNINTLLFDLLNRPIYKKYDLIYYGTYRANRNQYLQKYFINSDFYLSSSSKNIRKFSALARLSPIFCDKINWEQGKETLNLFKYSLYIEDEYTHSNFNFLSNRFYECLKCNVVQFFDISCRNTLEESGYPILEKYFVSSHAELKNKVESLDWQQCWNEQFNAWHRLAMLEQKDVLNQLDSILNE